MMKCFRRNGHSSEKAVLFGNIVTYSAAAIQVNYVGGEQTAVKVRALKKKFWYFVNVSRSSKGFQESDRNGEG